MSRKMIFIAGAATVAIVAVWYLVLWSPQGVSLTHAQASATAATQKEATLKAQVASLQHQRTQLPALQAQLAGINEQIPAAPNVDKVIDDVNAVVVASGVSLSTFTPPQPAPVVAGAAASPTAAVAEGFSVSVTGTYFQLVDFINKLNAMPRLTVVDAFSLATPDKATGKITTSISARVFVAPAAAAVTTTSTTSAGAHP